MIESLQVYLSMGWKVFPINPRTKKPITQHGFKDASTDLEQVKAWVTAHPGCAWGTPTSAERGVLDIDPRNGGFESLAALEAKHGALPLTPKVNTGGGGNHYWFIFPLGTTCSSSKEDANGGKVSTLYPGIDRKAGLKAGGEGGYVIIPPSKVLIPEHEGRPYKWAVKPWEVALAEAPSWTIADLQPKATCTRKTDPAEIADPWIVKAASEDFLSHPGVVKGKGESRTKTFWRLVGVHLGRGDSLKSIKVMAAAWASKCEPVLEDWERHVDGLWKQDEAKRLAMTTSIPLPPSDAAGMGGGRELTPAIDPEPEASGGGAAELVPSLHRSDDDGEGEEIDVVIGKAEGATKVPTLPPEAEYGLLGDMLRAVKHETEAAPGAILLGYLCCLGNIVGRGAWVSADEDHYPNLYVGIVGATSDAKGTAWGMAKYPFVQAETQWAKYSLCNGVGSGQGLIERVRDEARSQKVNKKTGCVEEQVIAGAIDKRCLLRLDELSICFKLQRSENSTLGETLLTAWGGEPLEVPNRLGNDLRATGYSISVMGDTQPGMIRKLVETGVEKFNGWLNRFLWAAVQGGEDRPFPRPKEEVYAPFLSRLSGVVAFAKTAGQVTLDDKAKALWVEVYGMLRRSGDSIPHTDRARPYVLRLALLFSLADLSNVIRLEHLRAALAVWSYCRQSASLIFQGTGGPVTPDPLWLKLLKAIMEHPGINRTGLREVVGHKVKGEEIDAALKELEAAGRVHRRDVKPNGGGRPAECWYPGPHPDGGGSDHANDNNPTSPSPPETRGREGINSAYGSDEAVELVPSTVQGENSAPVLSHDRPEPRWREGTNSVEANGGGGGGNGGKEELVSSTVEKTNSGAEGGVSGGLVPSTVEGENSGDGGRAELVCSLPAVQPEGEGSMVGVSSLPPPVQPDEDEGGRRAAVIDEGGGGVKGEAARKSNVQVVRSLIDEALARKGYTFPDAIRFAIKDTIPPRLVCNAAVGAGIDKLDAEHNIEAGAKRIWFDCWRYLRREYQQDEDGKITRKEGL